jgi:hypothetical protein
MDQEDTKLAGPLYRFICFSESNGNAMRLIWMLTNALSRLLNPLNCSPARPHNAVTLAAYLQRPHQSHSLLSGQSGLQKVASSNCLLDGQKICTSWVALDVTTRTSCPSIAAGAKGTLCPSIAASTKGSPNAAPNCHHAKCLP